jgi:hypothetical protein
MGATSTIGDDRDLHLLPAAAEASPESSPDDPQPAATTPVNRQARRSADVAER